MVRFKPPPGQGAIPLMGTSDPRAPELNAICVGRNLICPKYDLENCQFKPHKKMINKTTNLGTTPVQEPINARFTNSPHAHGAIIISTHCNAF